MGGTSSSMEVLELGVASRGPTAIYKYTKIKHANMALLLGRHAIMTCFTFTLGHLRTLMAPKKKAKKSGGAGKSGDGAEDALAIDNTPPLVIPLDVPHYVTLDLRLLNWSYLNFKLRVKTTTRLFAIKHQIHKRHGPITELKICKGHFAEANEMREDMDTLADYGIEGAPEDETPEVVCLLHYDFKPQQHDNPLLLATEDK